MNYTQDTLWAGTEASFQIAAEAHQQALLKAGVSVPDELSIYERQGSVGVVSIAGSLIPGSAGWGQYFGVLGYDDIRAGFMEALADTDVSSILVMYSSGGGAVMGMADTASFISQASKLKPVHAYVDVAASAAYRLAIESESITIADAGLAGSIGVLRMHVERSKQNEEAGVKVTVLRAGEHKALMNPFEPLTEAAIAQENERLAYLADLFNRSVQTRRGLTPEDMKDKAGEGREFLGQMAVKVGLADKVGTYESALKAAAKSVDNPKVKARVAGKLANASLELQNADINMHNTDMKKPTFSTEQLAAIAAGTPGEVTAESLAAELTATAEALATAEAALVTAQATAATSEAALTVATQELSATKATLASQLEANTVAQASVDSCREVLVASLGNMAIAMGGTKPEIAADVTMADILDKHKVAAEAYTTKFKVGGVAAVASISKAPVKSVPTGLFAAILRNNVK